MFAYRIQGYHDAMASIAENWPTRIVSVTPPSMVVKAQGPHHLVMPMRDVTDTRINGAPTVADIEDILAFTADLGDDDRLLVHCWMGRSRSPAVMMAVLIQHGFSYESAYSLVTEDPMVEPNHLICRHIRRLFSGEKTV